MFRRVSAPFSCCVPFGTCCLHYLLMRFKLPFNDRIRVRLMEKVDTVDDTYRIVDTGLEYNDGSIDSIAVGGNFASLSGWCGMREDEEEYTPEETPAA